MAPLHSRLAQRLRKFDRSVAAARSTTDCGISTSANRGDYRGSQPADVRYNHKIVMCTQDKFFGAILRLSLHQSVKQIPYGKQCETKNTTPEIEVMANAVFESPMQPGKQAKCFADMSKDDNHQRSRADYLQERPYVFSLCE